MSSTTHALPSSLPLPPLPDPGARWALLLDVDGTLLDFADDPQAVLPCESLLQLLHALHQALGGALALVSGRGLDDLDRMFGHPRWAAAGLHGLELRHADGSFRRRQPLAVDESRMRDAVMTLAARFDGVQLEDKQSALALHCRREPVQFAALLAAAMALMPQLHGYELQPGHHVLEFKPSGTDKGRAVQELIARPPFLTRLPVYLGDDLTDEHGFQSVNRLDGISVRIGQREPSHAHYSLASPATTQDWLQRVLDALVQGASAHVRPPAGNPPRQS